MVSAKNSVSPKVLMIAAGLSAALGLSGCAEQVEVASTPEEKQATLTRIRPVVTLDDLMSKQEVPAEAPAAAAPAVAEPAPPAAAPVAAGPSAKSLYDKACMACHTTGAAGAPKLGDKAAWEPRYAMGMDSLMATAKTGKGAMPPNGASTYSETEMRQVIEFMLGEAGLI